MAKFVDGFVIPVKKKDLKEYKKMATVGCKAWMKHGALEYYECVSDELDSPFGQSFAKLCKLKPDEVVIFAFAVYKSKAHRNSVMKKVHSDPSMAQFQEMPFDVKRLTTGLFKVLVQNK